MLKNLLTLLAVGTAMTASAEVIYEGSFDTGKWANNLQIEGSKFANAAEGNLIFVNFTINDGASYGNLEFDSQKGSWEKLSGNAARTNTDQYDCYPAGTTESAVTLSAADVTDLKEFGLALKGENVTISKVQLLADAPEEATTWTWEGNEVFGNWTNLEIPATKVKFMKEGMKIVFYFTVAEGKEYGNIALKDGDWNELEALNKTATNKDSYNCYPMGTTESTFTCDAASAAKIAEGGLKVSAQDIVLTKIVFNPENGDDPNPPTPPTPADSYTWEGSINTGNWDANGYLEIPADKLQFVKEGTAIVIDFTVDGEFGQIALQSDWTDIPDTNSTGTNKDEYNCFQPDVTTSTYTLAAADVDKLKAKGLIIKGQNVILTKVFVNNGGTQNAISNIAVDNTNAPVEYYTLQGVRVNNPAAGTIVIRRQGTEVSKIRF